MKLVQNRMAKPLAVLIIFFVLLAVGCSKSEPQKEAITSQESAKALTKVRVAMSKNIWNSLTLVAMERGYFAKEGIEIDASYMQAGRYCLDAILSGSAEFANIVEVNIAFLGFTGNDNVKVIGTIVSSSESSAIVARKSSGITNPKDLKGKTLALAPGTTSDVFANRFINKYGLSPNNVEIMKIQPQAIQGAIVSKGVDAVSIWQPFVYNTQKALGDDAVVFADTDVYTGYEVMAVSKDWASKNQSLIADYLRAIRFADDFIKSNPEQAQAIVGNAISLEGDIVSGIWSQYDFSLALNKKVMVKAVDKIGEWIRTTQEGYIGKDLPDYSQYFDPSFLQETISGK